MSHRCYISSTFSDLKEERKLVFDWLAKQGGLFTPVNSEAQSPDPILQSCFNDIERCNIYILLLGARYGTRCDGQYGDDLSYTHHEFRHAHKQGKQCFAYRIEESRDYADVSPDDVASRNGFWEEVGKNVRPLKTVAADKLIDELSTSLIKYVHGSYNEGVSGLAPQPPPNDPKQLQPNSNSESLEAMPAILVALMIELKETGGSGTDGSRFEFDAELFIESSATGRGVDVPWGLGYQELSLDVGPRQNKHFWDLGPYIAECWSNAEAKLYRLKAAGTIPAYTLYVEIFTCRIAVDQDFGHLVISSQPCVNGSLSQNSSTRKKTLLSVPFLLRSLDRLSDDSRVRNNLEDQWLKTKQPVTTAIATCKCPYAQGHSEASNPQKRLESFYTRLATFPAHFHLPSLPHANDQKEEFFIEVVWSGIPIALWWNNVRDRSRQVLLQRCQLLFEQIAGEDLSNQLKAEKEDEEAESILVDLKLSGLMMHDLAIRRRNLFAIDPDWISDLVLLIDCPGRHPKKYQTRLLNPSQ